MKIKLSRALMVAVILALVFVGVAYAEEEKPEHRIRVQGEIIWVDLRANAFGLHARSGEEYRFEVDRGTHFRSPDGSVKEFSDLEAGMRALVIGLRGEEILMARLVVAIKAEPRPERIRVMGEITDVVPDRGTFTLQTIEGSSVIFQTGERTRFISRDGSVLSIEDLRVGMVASVSALKREDGLFALVVAAKIPEDPPDRVWGRGRILSLGDQVFTIESGDGSEMTFFVDSSTRYRSRDGSVHGFEDLQVGMFTIVAAVKLEDGQLKAVLVGVARVSRDAPSGVENCSGQADKLIVPISP